MDKTQSPVVLPGGMSLNGARRQLADDMSSFGLLDVFVPLLRSVTDLKLMDPDKFDTHIFTNKLSAPRVVQLYTFVLVFNEHTRVPKDKVIPRAARLEHECYSRVYKTVVTCASWGNPEFMDAYSDLCGDICSVISGHGIKDIYSDDYEKFIDSLSGPNFIEFIQKIVNNGIDAEFPESTRKEREEIREKRDVRVEEKESTLYKCKYCSGQKCSWTTVQTRALDEAVTIMVTCLNPVCRRKFAIS